MKLIPPIFIPTSRRIFLQLHRFQVVITITPPVDISLNLHKGTSTDWNA
jgi:hypothetical protein